MLEDVLRQRQNWAMDHRLFAKRREKTKVVVRLASKEAHSNIAKSLRAVPYDEVVGNAITF
jgi:hypothetical protein